MSIGLLVVVGLAGAALFFFLKSNEVYACDLGASAGRQLRM